MILDQDWPYEHVFMFSGGTYPEAGGHSMSPVITEDDAVGCLVDSGLVGRGLVDGGLVS